MLTKGTRIIDGEEAILFTETLGYLREEALSNGFSEVILPTIAQPSIWSDRSGKEIEGQMWVFNDRGDRPTCLIPEATAMIQRIWDEKWKKEKPKPYKILYTTKCFRYERPQKGRYREFTQFGIEVLGGNIEENEVETKQLLQSCLKATGVDFEYVDQVKRGLSYYNRNGFEATVDNLGAQRQIAGGGSYEQGVGWAIGVDRLVLSLMENQGDSE